MEPDEAGHGKGSHSSGGGTIQMFDPRVSRGIAIFMGILGTLAVAVLCWVALSITELNVNVARVVARLDSKESVDDSQNSRLTRVEDRVEDITGDVRTLEGRNLRGGPHK